MRSPGSSNKLLAGFLVTAFGAVAFADERITLRDVCPPGFELTDSNVCELRTLYDGYDSLNDAGVGGLKTALPSARDGFSPQQIDLGRYLFFDPLLSGDNSLSCASCHHPDLAFTDGRPRAVGIGGAEVKRGAPSLWNVAFLAKFFWDARASSLEKQMQGPLYSPDEMGTSPAVVVQKLGDNPTYVPLHGNRRVPGITDFSEQPLRPVRPRLSRCADRQRNRRHEYLPFIRRPLRGMPHTAFVHEPADCRHRRAGTGGQSF
jgi:hypothetical protein